MKILSKTIEWLKKSILFLQKKQYKTNSVISTTFNSLAPKILKEEKELNTIRPYLDSLKRAIDSEDINNIALTGSYGSGKSTILKTFRYLNPEYEYLNISLASFKDNKEKNPELPDFERKLEVSILQQMFYHVEPSQIPDSRFKRIVNLTPQKLIVPTLFLIFWALSILYLFKFDYIEKLNPREWNHNYPIDWIAVLSSSIFFLGIGLFVRNFYRLFKNSKINKLSIKGELELGEAIDKSVFNQHLEEILYFFERTKFNVVIIEDVDRFDSTDIFTKLREINVLINNSNLIERSVKFIYAIKDEMFKDKNERVKFFEYIIPIIPFINPSNASDQLAKLVEEAELQNALSGDFTSDIVTFIDDIDMRLLINIFHEYQLYKNLLSSDLRQDNLFAIIVYKNLYPNDFGELQKRKGLLYHFFASKPTYIETISKQHKIRITQIDNQIKLLEVEADISITELRAIYISKIVSTLGNFYCFYVNLRNVSLWDALKDENFITLKNSTNTQYLHHIGYGVSNSPVTLKSIEKEISSNSTYDQREKRLIDRANNQINILKTEKENLKLKVNEVSLMSIKELFETIDSEEHLGDFKDNNLMRALLLNGYIDEHYDDYISLFHEVNLTKEDFVFERKVKSGYSLPFDYGIAKVENLLKHIPDKYFKKEVILNFQLLAFLLNNEVKYKIKLEYFLSELSIDGEKQFEFIRGFIKNKSGKVDLFIEKICTYKPTLWEYIYTKSGLPDEEIRELLKHIFEYVKIDAILKLKHVDSLSKFLEEKVDLFTFVSSCNNIRNLKEFISKKLLRFKNLDSATEDQKEFFEFIYSNSYYQINEHNINIITQVKTPNVNTDELHHSNYTTITKLDLKVLKNYIDNNIEDYIVGVMTQPKNVHESEKTVIDILNRENVKIELKERVLISQQITIQSILDIDEFEIMKLVLVNKKIKVSWENVFNYIDSEEENEELDNTLIDFLNISQNYEVLSKIKLNSVSGRDGNYIEKISRIILENKDLDIEAYKKLLDSIPYNYNSINYEEFDADKIQVLLNKKRLTLTITNFDGLKSKSRKFSTLLIENHQNEFIETYSNFTTDSEDWLLILQSPTIGHKNKLSMISKIDDSIIINSSAIANLVCQILPTDVFISLRYEVLDAMFKSNSSLEKRLGLINLHFAKLDNDQVQSLVEKLGDNYAKIFAKQYKPVFPETSLNTELFTKLRERDLIIRFEPDKENSIRVYAKYIGINDN